MGFVFFNWIHANYESRLRISGQPNFGPTARVFLEDLTDKIVRRAWNEADLYCFAKALLPCLRFFILNILWPEIALASRVKGCRIELRFVSNDNESQQRRDLRFSPFALYDRHQMHTRTRKKRIFTFFTLETCICISQPLNSNFHRFSLSYLVKIFMSTTWHMTHAARSLRRLKKKRSRSQAFVARNNKRCNVNANTAVKINMNTNEKRYF